MGWEAVRKAGIAERASAAPLTTRSEKAAQPNNPLHAITLENLVTALVSFHGWPELGRRIEIRCFTHDPSIASSLKFLRRTPWAREKVEALYIETLTQKPADPENPGEGHQ